MKINSSGIAFKISRIVFFILLSLDSMEVFSQKTFTDFKPVNFYADNAKPDVFKEQDWWKNQNRMIQTNLREIDVKMNLDEYINTLKDFGANVVLVNVGGIVANYPTNLPFHYRNPFLENDFVGEVIMRLHAEGIRVIGRFDFSKINETIANNHPDWLSCDTLGKPFPAFNGQVPTCVNGGYQQKAIYQILDEVLSQYPLDGVFFNMIGYPRHDYSGRYLGICHCEGCQTRFREMYQMDLPRKEDILNPVYRNYQAFCQRTIEDQFRKVNSAIKTKYPNIVICTYTEEGVDVIRMEANTPRHEWSWEDSERAKYVLMENPNHQLACVAVHFVELTTRHSSVSPWLTQRRILQNMVNGSWLDYYCIGALHIQEDRIGLDQLHNIYRFHQANEKWLLNTRELSVVGLVVDGVRSSDEYRGLYEILAQSHITFDLVSLNRSDIFNYQTLIVPDGVKLPVDKKSRLDEYVKNGGRLLITGKVIDSLQCLGVKKAGDIIPSKSGTYLRIRAEDKIRLAQPVFDKLDLVFLKGELNTALMDSDVEGFLRFIPAAMFGPPEKCYYTGVSDTPALYLHNFEKGRVAWFPWAVGTHFRNQGHAGHAALVEGVLTELLELPVNLKVDASPMIEVNHRAAGDNSFEWVSLINLSGQLDKFLQAPVPFSNIPVRIKPGCKVKSVTSLSNGNKLKFDVNNDGTIAFTIPQLNEWEIVLLQ